MQNLNAKGAATEEQRAVKEAYVVKSKGIYNQMQMQDQTEQLMEMGMDEQKSRMVSKQLNAKVQSKKKKGPGGGGGGGMPLSMGMPVAEEAKGNESEDEAEAATAIFASEGLQMQKLEMPEDDELSGAKKGKKISSAFTGAKKKKGKVRMDDELVAAMGRK